MNRLFRIFLFICPFLTCFSCEEPFPQLPEETQTGAQTFGCLVNNELVFARNDGNSYYYYVGRVGAVYDIETDRLEITATCQFNQQFIFSIDHPQQGTELKLNQIRYLLPNSTDWIEAKDIDRIYLTRFDKNASEYQGVVSGTFSFELPGIKSVKVTKGRFDMVMDIVNYQY